MMILGFAGVGFMAYPISATERSPSGGLYFVLAQPFTIDHTGRLSLMEKLLLIAALVCQPGERLIDLSSKLPRGLQFMDVVISVEPFYSRLYIYQLGYPDSFQRCCSNNQLRFYAFRSGTVDFASGKASQT